MKQKKIVWWIVGIVCVVLIVINLAKNSLVENALKARVKDTLGMDVSIDAVNVGLLGAKIRLDGLTIANTAEFGNKDFIKIPLFSVDSSMLSLLGGKKRIDEIKLHVADVGIVKNSAGELNLSRLKTMAAGKAPLAGDGSEDKASGVDIGQFILTFDHLTFWDFSKGDEPEKMVIPVRVSHQTFKDVTSMQQVGQTVVMAAVLEGTAREGGMDEIFTLGDNLTGLGGPEMKEKLNEFKEKFNAQGK